MKRISIVAVAFAMVSASLAAYALLELRKSRNAVTATVRERDDLQTRLKNSEDTAAATNARLAQAQLNAESLKEDLGRLFPQKSPPSPTTLSVPAAATPTLSAANTPAGRSMAPAPETRYGSTMFVAGRYRGPRTSFVRNPPSLRSLDTIYPALYRQLKLNAEQATQFKTLAVEIAERFSDLDRRAKSEQKRPGDPTMQPLYAAVDTEYRKKLVELVGAEAIPIVEHFAETLFLREAVIYVAGDLYYTNEPLQESQANRLLEILSRNLRDPNGRIDTVFADAPAMKAAARDVLSPLQLAAWDQFIAELAKTSFAQLQPRPASGMTTR